MRYIIVSVLLLVFIGCGGSSNSDENPPISPQTKESKNMPPAIPKI